MPRRYALTLVPLFLLCLSLLLTTGPRSSDAQDVPPTPRGRLGGPVPLDPGDVPPGGAAAATEPAPGTWAAACTVAPRTLDEILTMAATPAAESTPTVATAPAGLTDGELPDAASIAGIRATLDELTACLSAGEPLRVLALFSDHILQDVLAGATVANITANLAEGATPQAMEEAAADVPLVRDEDLRLLPDGRVGAFAAEENGLPAEDNEVREYIIFIQQGDRWLIDEYDRARPAADVPAAATPTIAPAANLPAPVMAALEAAAAHLDLPLPELMVVRMERQEWPDSALGCPEEGGMYAQVITPGYLVVISGGGRELEYHTDEGTNVVLCEER